MQSISGGDPIGLTDGTKICVDCLKLLFWLQTAFEATIAFFDAEFTVSSEIIVSLPP